MYLKSAEKRLVSGTSRDIFRIWDQQRKGLLLESAEKRFILGIRKEKAYMDSTENRLIAGTNREKASFWNQQRKEREENLRQK